MIKAIKVKPLDNYLVEILFSDGTVKMLNMNDKLNHPLFKSLKDKSLFNQVTTDGYSVNWGEDIEICVESIYNSN